MEHFDVISDIRILARTATYAIPPYPIAAPDSASLRCLNA